MSNMNTRASRTFSLNGTTITVQQSTIRSRMAADSAWMRLNSVLPEPPDDTLEMSYRRAFGRVIAQTTDASGLGWQLPNVNASANELAAAFEQFLDLPGGLGDLWMDAVDAVDAPPGDPNFLPPDKMDEEAKKK